MKAVLILDNPMINNHFQPLLEQQKCLSLLDTSLKTNLLSMMYSYINSYFSRDKIYIVCTKFEYEFVKQSIPNVVEENILVEPERISYTFSLLFANVMLDCISQNEVVCCFPVNHLSTCNFMLQSWFLSIPELAAKDLIVMPSIILNKNDVVPVYIDGGKIVTNLNGVDYFHVNEIAYIDFEKPHSHRKKKIFGKQGHLLNVLCGNTSAILSLYRSRESANVVSSLKRLITKGDFNWKALSDFYKDFKVLDNFDIYSECEKLVVVFLNTQLTDLTTWNDYIDKFATDKSRNVIYGNVNYKDCQNVICYNYVDNEEINIEQLNNLIIIKKYGNITIRNI